MVNCKDIVNTDTQSTLIICRFHIGEFAYLLELICNHRNQYFQFSEVICRRGCAQSSKSFELPCHTEVAQLRLHRAKLAFLFQLSYYQQVSFSWYI